MATTLELEGRIRRLKWSGLRGLWKNIKSDDLADWQPGEAFEYLVLRAFELDRHEHAVVRYPYNVELFGQRVEEIDGAVHLAGLSCLIESKEWDKNVEMGPIAKMRSQLLRRPAGTIGAVFSKTNFTQATIHLAHFAMPQAILLWSGRELERALEEERICAFMRLKHRASVERGIPDYNIPEEGLP